MCRELVSTYGRITDTLKVLSYVTVCSVLILTQCSKNELCHIGSVLDSTFRLMLHVKRASLDLGLLKRTSYVTRAVCLCWLMERLDFRRFHRNRYQWIPSEDLPTLLSKYCLPFRFYLMTRLPVTQVHSTVLPVPPKFSKNSPIKPAWQVKLTIDLVARPTCKKVYLAKALPHSLAVQILSALCALRLPSLFFESFWVMKAFSVYLFAFIAFCLLQCGK